MMMPDLMGPPLYPQAGGPMGPPAFSGGGYPGGGGGYPGAYQGAFPAYPGAGMYPPNVPPPNPMKKLGNGLLGLLGLGATAAAIMALLSALGLFPLSPFTPNTGGGGSPDLIKRVTFVSRQTWECLGINGAEASGTPLVVRGCDSQNPDPAMQWFLTGNGRIVHRDAGNGWFCMDVPNNSHDDNQQMQVYGCDWPGEAPQQYYQVGSGTIMLADGSMCVGVDARSHYCTGDPSQGWAVNELPMVLTSELPTPRAAWSALAAQPDGGAEKLAMDDLTPHGPAEFLSAVGKTPLSTSI